MKITKKQKYIFYAALGVIFLAVVGENFVSNLYSRLSDLRQQIRLAEGKLKKGLRVQQNKNKIMDDYEKYKPYLVIPADNEKQVFAELLREVERLVSSLNGTIVNLTPQDESDVSKTHKEYKAKFRIEIGHARLLEFLNAVQESQRLLKLEKLTVNAPDEQADILRVDGVISLAVPL